MIKPYSFFFIRMLYGLIIFSSLFGFCTGVGAIFLGENIGVFWSLFFAFTVLVCIYFFIPIILIAFIRWVLQRWVKFTFIVNFSLLFLFGALVILNMGSMGDSINTIYVRYAWIFFSSLIFLSITEVLVKYYNKTD